MPLPNNPCYKLLSSSRARHAHLSGFRGDWPRPSGGVFRRWRDAALRPEYGAEHHSAGDADQGRYVPAVNLRLTEHLQKSWAFIFHPPLRRQRANQPRGQPPDWARLHHCAREPHHPLPRQQDGYVFTTAGAKSSRVEETGKTLAWGLFVQVKWSIPWWLTWMQSRVSPRTRKALTSSLAVSRTSPPFAAFTPTRLHTYKVNMKTRKLQTFPATNRSVHQRVKSWRLLLKLKVGTGVDSRRRRQTCSNTLGVNTQRQNLC